MTHTFMPAVDTHIVEADDDDAMVAAALSDPETFGQLYDRYWTRVHRYLETRAATPEDAADLTQQVFLNTFRGLEGYRSGRSGFAAWLFRIARNVATDAYRRKRPAVPLERAVNVPSSVDGESPEAAALSNERAARLNEAIARFEPAKQELLALRFAAGLSAMQIAVVVGKSESAVKKQLWRTIQALKEDYRDELSTR